jgi:ribosomal protein L11 methyltransferase
LIVYNETMYLVQMEIPSTLTEEIGQILFSIGALSVSHKKVKTSTHVESIFKSTKELAKHFDQELFTTKKINTTYWQNKWFKYYKAFEINKDILIKPYTDKKKYKQKYVITLDPRYAFGDGQHPTTTLALRTLYSALSKKKFKRLLDIGTGTGVLAILANQMGLTDVSGFDIEAQAIRSARKNNTYNKTKCRFFKADAFAYREKRKYDLIVINMISAQMEKALPRVKELLTPNGLAIATGISKRWSKDLEKTFISQGFRLLQKTSLKDWNCFTVTL